MPYLLPVTTATLPCNASFANTTAFPPVHSYQMSSEATLAAEAVPSANGYAVAHPLNVGIVGCGTISAAYLKTFPRLETVKVVAVADIDFAARSGHRDSASGGASAER